MEKIKIGILGYGNLGKGVEQAIIKCNDLELVAVFTRRDSIETVLKTPSYNISNLDSFVNKIDVMILCGGSATDLPVQGVEMLKKFNTVDSFDTHAKIPQYFEKMEKVGRESGKLGIISVGWDPGLFSIARQIFGAILPDGNDYTFWGKGVSQGHSDAIRRIEGVENAIQYTVPIETALNAVRSGSNPILSTRDKHNRVCYVVAKDGADKNKIESEIVNMPNYFADYNTEVNFVTKEELAKNHSKLPHGGFVMRSGQSADNVNHLLELKIQLDSNPQFTSSILVAYARAIYKMATKGQTGAVTVFDVPIGLLSPKSAEELRAKLL